MAIRGLGWLAVLTALLALALAACGGDSSTPAATGKTGGSNTTFRHKNAFENYAANYLGVENVDCRKIETRKAICTTNEGGEVVVLCLSTADSGLYVVVQSCPR